MCHLLATPSAKPVVLGSGRLQILNSGAGLPKDQKKKKRLFWVISSSSDTQWGKFDRPSGVWVNGWDVFGTIPGNVQWFVHSETLGDF